MDSLPKSRLLRFVERAMVLARRAVVRFSTRYSRKRFTLRQHVVLLCLKVKKTTTYRDLATREQKLNFNFRNMGSNPTAFRDIYAELFYDRRNEFEELLGDTEGLVTGNKLTLIEETYDIPVDSYEDYFDAYTAALHEAFVDLICTEPDLIQLMGETFERAVAEYQ